MFASALANLGVDLVTVSGGGVLPQSAPPVAVGYQLPAAEAIKQAGVAIKVAGVGMLFDPHFTNSIIEDNKVDAVSLARAFLFNPKWGFHAAAALNENVDYPPQYMRCSPAL